MGAEDMSHRLDVLVRRIDREPDRTTVALAGELDFAVVPQARTILEAERRRGRGRLRIDLAAVEFVDASALDVFATLDSTLSREGRALELVGGASWIRRVVVLAGLQSLLLAGDASANGDRHRLPERPRDADA